MSIAMMLNDQSHRVVEAGGFYWKIKRVKSKDLMRAGIASLVHLAPDLAGIENPSNEEEVAKQLQDNWMKKLSALSDIQQARLYDSLDAIVCCGVIEVSEDGEIFEAIRITMKEKEHKPEKSVVLVDTLPHQIRQTLAAEIQTHSRESLGDAEAVATFRKGA
jgi:hypothetical protein